MPNDLAVRPTPLVAPVSETSGSKDAVSDAVSPQLPQGDTARPNPSLRLDGALGMVIIEFRSESGAVTASIPTERQLAAYRVWERTGTDGAPPPGRSPHAAADPTLAADPHATAKKRT
jgi:hypothetical protein